MDEAISHIHENGSGHTEAIITGVRGHVCPNWTSSLAVLSHTEAILTGVVLADLP